MAAANAPTAPGRGPTSYLAFYEGLPNLLAASYEPLYARHAIANGVNSNVLLNQAVRSSQAIPKVYLCLVRNAALRFEILAVHRPTAYTQNPLRTTPWDDVNIAFIGDIAPGNFIKTVEFPDDAFTLTGAQVVPTIDGVTALLATHPNARVLPPVILGAPDTQEIETRSLVQVPQEYVRLVLSHRLSPRQAWEEVAGAIMNDNREVECEHLLTWLRVAVTQQVNAADAAAPLPPANFLGNMHVAFPALDEDEDLHLHRWTVMRQDLPALDESNMSATAHMVSLVGALRTDRAVERANDDARRLQDTEPKLPSETKFKHTTIDWMRFCGVGDETLLPDLYGEIANHDKGEHLSLLRTQLKLRVRQVGAATKQVPVASKELLEMIRTANYFCEPHELNDLTLGLQPFSVGLFVGDSLSKTTQARAAGYEQMMQGTVNPTLAEQATFVTKEVRIPQDIFTTKMMLCTLSIILDVVQGPTAELATAYRNFCKHSWDEIAVKLHVQSVHNPSLLAQVIPGILRWLQLHIQNYIRIVMEGAQHATIPDFHQLSNMVLMEQWHQLPHLPSHYRLDLIEEAKKEAAFRRTPGTTPGPPTGEPPPRTGRANVVMNQVVKTTWKASLEASNKRLKDLDPHAIDTEITDPKTGKKVSICFSWHLLGQCYENCRRCKTHRALTPAETTKVQKVVDDHLQE
jgi:hypothetical protein